MMKSNPVAEKVTSMVLNSDRALAIFKSGNISRSRHLPVVPSGLFVSRISTQDCVPQALTYLGCLLQTSHKIVILSEAPHRFIAWYSAWWRGVEGPRRCLSCQCCSELFHYPSPRTEFFLRYALDGHGYIFSCTVIIFHPQSVPNLCTVAGPPGAGLGG